MPCPIDPVIRATVLLPVRVLNYTWEGGGGEDEEEQQEEQQREEGQEEARTNLHVGLCLR